MAKRIYILFLFIIYSSLAAREWHTVCLDSFVLHENGDISMAAREGYGYAVRENPHPKSNIRFWIKGDIYFPGSPLETEAFFLFGKKTEDHLQLWAAGYSLSQKMILFGRVDRLEDGRIEFTTLAKKPVEIRDRRNQYVFMFIFLHETNKIKIEVNGVPMPVKSPILTSDFGYSGYMVKGQLIRFQKMEIRGE